MKSRWSNGVDQKLKITMFSTRKAQYSVTAKRGRGSDPCQDFLSDLSNLPFESGHISHNSSKLIFVFLVQIRQHQMSTHLI